MLRYHLRQRVLVGGAAFVAAIAIAQLHRTQLTGPFDLVLAGGLIDASGRTEGTFARSRTRGGFVVRRHSDDF